MAPAPSLASAGQSASASLGAQSPPSGGVANVYLEAMACECPVIASHADEELTVKPSLGGAGEQSPPRGLTPLGEIEITDQITLPPFGVQVFKIAENH